MKLPKETTRIQRIIPKNRWWATAGSTQKKLPVMYPFGYGLTYTTFEYNDLKTDKTKYDKNDMITFSFELKNKGKMTADEVVQVYVRRINPSDEWPEKELKAFSRVALNPGEGKNVTLEILVKNLQYWNEKKHARDDDLCNIELQIGASAGDVILKKEVGLK